MATYQISTQAKQGWVNKLKAKWGLSSAWQVALILLAFTLAGSSVVVLRKFFFALLGFNEQTAFWLKTVTYILFVFPAYQVLLLTYGTLLGQFAFFWEKEKKMVLAVAGLFKGRRKA
jgi:hypothetical protein